MPEANIPWRRPKSLLYPENQSMPEWQEIQCWFFIINVLHTFILSNTVWQKKTYFYHKIPSKIISNNCALLHSSKLSTVMCNTEIQQIELEWGIPRQMLPGFIFARQLWLPSAELTSEIQSAMLQLLLLSKAQCLQNTCCFCLNYRRYLSAICKLKTKTNSLFSLKTA